jgi:phosphoribosyl-AMP cyclohydrolase
MSDDWLNAIKWNDAGLVPVVAQDVGDGRILMVAWMNRAALQLTVSTGHAVYWSRSRNRLWHKGEESGNQQVIKEIRLDCDNDVIIVRVEQKGGVACHTGRRSCFFQRLEDGEWKAIDPVLKDPSEMYERG